MITYNEQKDLYIHSDPRWPRFKEIVAGVGWLDPKGDDMALLNWGVVIGHKEDGGYSVLGEITGDVMSLCEKLTAAKDTLLIQRIFCDRTLPQLTKVLVDHDGLTRYFSKGKDVFDREQYLNPPEHWPTFRDRETKATLIPLVEDLTADMQAAVELVRRLVDGAALKIRSECPNMMRIVRLSLDELLTHPGIKALAYPLTILEREKARRTTTDRKPPIIYGNLRR